MPLFDSIREAEAFAAERLRLATGEPSPDRRRTLLFETLAVVETAQAKRIRGSQEWVGVDADLETRLALRGAEAALLLPSPSAAIRILDFVRDASVRSSSLGSLLLLRAGEARHLAGLPVDRSITCYRRGLGLEPAGSVRALLLYNLGERLMSAGRAAEAVPVLTEAAASNPAGTTRGAFVRLALERANQESGRSRLTAERTQFPSSLSSAAESGLLSSYLPEPTLQQVETYARATHEPAATR